MSVDSSDVFAYESRLAPRAASQDSPGAGHGREDALAAAHLL